MARAADFATDKVVVEINALGDKDKSFLLSCDNMLVYDLKINI